MPYFRLLRPQLGVLVGFIQNSTGWTPSVDVATPADFTSAAVLNLLKQGLRPIVVAPSGNSAVLFDNGDGTWHAEGFDWGDHPLADFYFNPAVYQQPLIAGQPAPGAGGFPPPTTAPGAPAPAPGSGVPVPPFPDGSSTPPGGIRIPTPPPSVTNITWPRRIDLATTPGTPKAIDYLPAPLPVLVSVGGKRHVAEDASDLANSLDSPGGTVIRADGSSAIIQEVWAPGWTSPGWLVDGNPMSVVEGQGWFTEQRPLAQQLAAAGQIPSPTLWSAPTITIPVSAIPPVVTVPPGGFPGGGDLPPSRDPNVAIAGVPLSSNTLMIGGALLALWFLVRK